MHAQNLLVAYTQVLFRSRDFVSSGEKGPTRADIAPLPVAHAQNILPNRITSGHVTDVTSNHVISGHAQWSDPPHDPPQILTDLSPYTTEVCQE